MDQEVIEFAGKIFELARSGDATALAAYIDAGVPVNLSNDKGDTLLMLAAYHGHEAAVRVLLERGADPDRPNDRGQTPIAGAMFKSEPGVVRALLDGGADPHAGHPTAADTARMFGQEEMLSWFTALKHQADGGGNRESDGAADLLAGIDQPRGEACVVGADAGGRLCGIPVLTLVTGSRGAVVTPGFRLRCPSLPR